MTLPDVATLLRDFVPSPIQGLGLLAVFASGLVMLVLGRAVLGARALPEIALMAGWGAVSLVLTLWGVLTPQNMRAPAIGLIAIAAIASVLPRGRLTKADLIALGRLLLVALPLIAVFAAAYPSQPDSFTNQVPNALYLYDYGQFPGVNRSPMLAVWPAFPYNLQLATLIPALLAPDFPPDVLLHVNLLLQLAFALLLARAMRGQGVDLDAPPSWAAIGGGILLTTFINPGFDPKFQFSGYGDPAIAVAVAVAAWGAERLLAALAAGRSDNRERLALTFLLLAGVAIKQVSVVLMTGLVGTAFLIGAFDRRIGPVRALGALIPSFLPALMLIGIWRIYVASHFAPDAELTLLPFAQWNFAAIPSILVNAAQQIWERGPFFVLLYGVALGAIPLAMRRGRAPAGRMFLLTAGVTLAYTGFLVFTYIAHFAGEIGASAHSFFRYNLHLGLLATLAAVTLVRETWLIRGAPELGRGWRMVGIAAVALAAVTPVAAAGWIRADLKQPQPLVWDLARFAAPHLRDGDRVALLLPGDNRGTAFMLRVAIALTPRRHALAAFDDIPRADAEALAQAKANGDLYALISCVPPGLADYRDGDQAMGLKAGEAALLLNDHGTWRPVATHPYPAGLPPSRDWTAQLSPGPFCR